MRHKSVTIPATNGIDWKGIGYLFSIAGSLLLGAIAWPKPGDPVWHAPALVCGVTVSILGFGLRYLAHCKEQREIEKAKQESRR